MHFTQHYKKIVIILLLVVLTGFTLSVHAQTESSSPDPVAKAAESISFSGEYTFVAQIEQTLIPRAIPLNIGTTEERIDSQLTGEVRPDYTRFTWQFEVDANTPPIIMEQEGDHFFLLDGDRRTEIQNPLAGFTPSADFNTYLRAAQNIRPSDTTHPEYAVYDFNINGEELANLIMAEVDQHLTTQQHVSLAANTDSLKQITGEGRLYVDTDGLPRRQILTLHMPEVSEQYDARTHFTIDYRYTTPSTGIAPMMDTAGSVASPSISSSSSVPAADLDAEIVTNAGQVAATEGLFTVGIALVIILLAMFLLIRFYRKLRIIVPASLAAIMLLTPVLQPASYAYQLRLATAGAPATLAEALGVADDAAAEAEPEDEAKTTITTAGTPDQTNPFLPTAPAPAAQTNPASLTACGTGDAGTDSDADGLNDFVERCLGTSPYNFDTDNDGLTDTLEINGFVFTDTLNVAHTIYTNPHEADSNEDGLLDFFEWSDPGLAAAIDMDGDDLPNPWDPDNDGDLVPDVQDLDPFAATGYQPSFSIVTDRSGDTFNGYHYIDIQVQPQDLNHLRLSTTALDWPYDEVGTLQARDRSNLGELTFFPQLKITTNKVPYQFLQSQYNISVVKRGNVYNMFVPLLPVSDGGQITSFSTRVVYDLNQFTTLNWSKVEFVWSTVMEVSLDDGARTRQVPVAAYTESAFRLTGLQIAKNGAQDMAVIGTPAQQADHRQLANALFGVGGAFLGNAALDFNALTGRLTNPTTPITQTWGVPVADLAVATVTAPHPDEALAGFYSAAKLTDNFLQANGYDTGKLATVIVATETKTGLDNLESVADLSAAAFTFNLANITTQTIRGVALSHYQFNNGNWSTVDPLDFMSDLLNYYDEATFATIRSNLAQTYPLIDNIDLASILLGFYLSWSSAQVVPVTVDGVSLIDRPVSDEALNQQINLPAQTDFLTYLVEAQDFGVAGQGVIFDSPQAYHEYTAIAAGNPVLNIFGQTGEIVLEFSDTIIRFSKRIVGRSTVGAAFNISVQKIGEIIKERAQKRLIAKARQNLVGKLANNPKYINQYLQIQKAYKKPPTGVAKLWQGLLKKAAMIGKIFGVTVQIALLGWSLYAIWKTYDDFESPYDFEKQFALGIAITNTVIEVALTALGIVAIVFAVTLGAAAAALAFTFGVIILIIDLIGLIVQAIFPEAKIGDSLVATVFTKVFFGDVQLKTELRGINFRGTDVVFNKTGFSVAGATMTVYDRYTGRIEGFQYRDRLEKADTSAYFTASAGPDIEVSTTDNRDTRRCFYSGSSKYCSNDLAARYTFNNAGRDQKITFKYFIDASLEYTKYIFGGISKQDKTEYVTLPNDLSEGDRWDAATIYIDVLPATLDELLVWSELQNVDTDADGVLNTTEQAAQVSYSLSDLDADGLAEGLDWDSDNDGLSDGFEQATVNTLHALWYLADTDGDNLNDSAEYELDLSANLPDSDGDGLRDDQEVFHYNGTAWSGGGWLVDILGTQYWTFTDPLTPDNDNDNVLDLSEKANGTSPYAYNTAPALTLAAGPTIEDVPEGVYVRSGDTLSATLNLDNIGTGPITTTVSLCFPTAVSNINVTTGGDRQPATQVNGNCRNWDFSGNPLQLFQSFQVTMTAQATGATLTDTISAAVPYNLNGALQPISQTLPFVQDNTAPTLFISDPISNTILTSEFYVIGGSAVDTDSFIERVEVTVDSGTYTATLTDAQWGYTWDLPNEGNVTISAVAYDVVGNASTADSVQVTVDTLPPTITINLADNTAISAGQALSTTFPLSGTVSDNSAGIERVQLRYNDGPWRTIWNDAGAPLSANWSGLWEIPTVETAQGAHNLELRAYDIYGNVGPITRTVFIDVLPPTNDLTNRAFIQSTPRHVPAGPLEILGVASDAGNNPLPAAPAELTGTLNSIQDATVWLQVDNLTDNDAGATVNWIGDVNGDRLGDLAVGLPAADGGNGRVVVVKGTPGDWPVPNAGDLEFLADNTPSYVGTTGAAIGTIIHPAGDVNGDGIDDFLIGDAANDRVILILGNPNPNAANNELSGDSPFEVIIESTDAAESLAGLAAEQLAAAGDVTNDGLADILVSVTGVSNTVYLLAGEIPMSPYQPLDLRAAFQLDTGATGAAVAGVGDVNGDFIADFAVSFSNTVYLFSGGGGWIAGGLTTLTPSEAIATFATADSLPTLAATGDVNGDDIDDFAFSNGSTPVVVFGNDSNAFTTQTLTGFPSALSGFLSGVGDVDKDGRGDLLVGNANSDAYLISGANLSTAAATIEGVAAAAAAPYTAAADLAGDGSADLALVPTAAAATALGYDGFGMTVQAPFIPRGALPTTNMSAGTAVSLLPVAPTPAAPLSGDVIVAPAGGDYTSIQAAIDSGASRVLVEPGIYAESFTLGSDVTVIGSGADRTLLTIPGSVTNTVLITADGVSNAAILNLTILGEGNGTGLLVTGGATNVDLQRTVVQGFDTAVAVNDSTATLALRNNTIVGNVNGFAATNNAGVDVRNTIFAYNSGTALQYDATTVLELHQYNLYFANGTDLTPNNPGGGELFSDPLFNDYANGDFRTAGFSPVVDAGAPGDPVPPGAGSAVDIGHLEQSAVGFFVDDDYCSTCANDGLIWGVNAFDVIQDGVNAALADLDAIELTTPISFTVGVNDGVYTESVVISGSVNLVGRAPDTTTILGNGGPAVTFDAAVDAGVSSFTLIGGGSNKIGILLAGGSNTVDIDYNLIKGNSVGISVTERATGLATFNTIISNTTGVEVAKGAIFNTEIITVYDNGGTPLYTYQIRHLAESCFSTVLCEERGFVWLDTARNIIANNSSGLVANGKSVIFSDNNLLFNTVDYTNVITGLNDITGQDPLLASANGYLTVNSPAVDAVVADTPVPPGGGLAADLGWHELLAAPLSVFMGQPDSSIATESVGVGRVEYAIVQVADPASPITATLPVTWQTATLDSPGAKLTYWRATASATSNGAFYRVYSRAGDLLGNTETDVNDWFDGAFYVDGDAPVVTLTVRTNPYNSSFNFPASWRVLDVEVIDYIGTSFDVADIYFVINGQRVDGQWRIDEWQPDGVTPRVFYYMLRNPNTTSQAYTIDAVVIDGAGNQTVVSTTTTIPGRPTLFFNDDIFPPNLVTVTAPYAGQFVTETITVDITAGDWAGYFCQFANPPCESADSGVQGVEVSFDGGRTWSAATYIGLDNQNINTLYTYTGWSPPPGYDATTIPIRVRATDYFGLSTTEIVTITIDTDGPRIIGEYTYSEARGTYLDGAATVNVTLPPAVDGSGYTSRVDFAQRLDSGNIVSSTVRLVSGQVASGYAGEREDLGIAVGATDEFLNFTGEYVGTWYGGGFFIQSIRMDGVMDVNFSEWLTATERIDDDFRSGSKQTLWASWDFEGPFIGYQGASWGPDGQLWAYFDVFAGAGTNQPISGTATLPFDADIALQAATPQLGQAWTYDDGLGIWAKSPYTLSTELDPNIIGQDLREYGHDPTTGTTEMHTYGYEFLDFITVFNVLDLDTHRMVVYVLDNNLDVFSAFPTANSLDGSFQHYYEWPNVLQNSDLLKLPTAARQPAVNLSVISNPGEEGQVKTSDTITYVAELANTDTDAVNNLQILLSASAGLTYQAVTGAASSDCAAGNSCIITATTIPVNGTGFITITATTADDLTGINVVTTTASLQADLPLPASNLFIRHNVDTTPPDVGILTNPGNAIGVGNQQIFGYADDPGAGVALVEVSRDGANWQPASGTTYWTAVITAPDLPTWQLYARATDHLGLTSTVISETLVRDTTPPTLSVEPFPGVVGFTSYRFRGLTDDPAPAGARSRSVAVQFDDPNSEWFDASLRLTGSKAFYWFFQWALPAADGITHTVRFRAIDYAGNVTTTSFSQIVVDTIPPQLSVDSDLSIFNISNDIITGTVTDGRQVSRLSITLYPDTGNGVVDTITPNPDGTWSYELNQPAGRYTAYIEASDGVNVTTIGPIVLYNVICPPQPGLSIAVCALVSGTDLSLNWFNNAEAAGGYEVHISPTPYFTPGPATITTTLPAGSESYTDVGVIGDMMNTYYYVVPLGCAGCVTPTSNQVGKFEFAIVPGN